MLGHAAQETGQSPNPERRVAGDGDVVLATLEGGQPEVATSLTGCPVAEIGEGFREVVAQRRLAEASNRDDFLAYEVQPNDLRCLAFVEMALNRVSDFVM